MHQGLFGKIKCRELIRCLCRKGISGKMLKKGDVQKDYKKLKNKAKRYVEQGEYENALKYIELAAYIMYPVSLIHADYEFENMLKCIGEYLGRNHIYKIEDKCVPRVLFYDGFGYNLRGLACIYIQALVSAGVEILYLSNRNQQEELMQELMRNPKNKVGYLDAETELGYIAEIHKYAENFRPTHVFIYTTPFDAKGISAFYGINVKATKILINLSNNVYWLGANVADLFLEFSNYWLQFSAQIRGIAKEKLILMPYYPVIKSIQTDNVEHDYSNKKLVVSGGAVHKLMGSNIFFDIIKHILDKDAMTVFLYLGPSEPAKLKQLSKEYPDRIFFDYERKDFFEIIKKSYFYLSTYPIAGGLMIQYAAAAGKVPVTYTKFKENGMAMRELLLNPDVEFVFDDLHEMYKMIDNLLDDNNYRRNIEGILEKSVMTRHVFDREMQLLINTGKTSFKTKDYETHLEEGITYNILKEKERYYRLFFQKRRWKELIREFPIKFLLGLGIAVKEKLS